MCSLSLTHTHWDSQERVVVSMVSNSGVESDRQRLSQDMSSDMNDEDDDVFMDALRYVWNDWHRLNLEETTHSQKLVWHKHDLINN